MKKHLLLAAGLLAAGSAQGAVVLTLSDAIGDPASVVVTTGESFDVTLRLNSTAELTSGIAYLLEAFGSASGMFLITARDISSSAFPDLIVTDPIVLAPPNALLDPLSDSELGGLTAGPANGAGDFKIATYTIQVLASASLGTHTLGTNSAIAFDDALNELVLNQPVYSVTVVPEPASALLLGCGLAGILFHRRR